MTVKYKGLYDRKFDIRQTTVQLYFYEESICASFSHLTRKVATHVGNDLKDAMICGRFEVEWNGNADLWLYDVDFSYLTGMGDEGLLDMITEYCREYDYEVIRSDEI